MVEVQVLPGTGTLQRVQTMLGLWFLCPENWRKIRARLRPQTYRVLDDGTNIPGCPHAYIANNGRRASSSCSVLLEFTLRENCFMNSIGTEHILKSTFTGRRQ
jgi:hypothetical protein